MSVTGSTKAVAVLGYPVAHTMSPAMHNAAYEALGMDYVYIPCPVAPHALGDAIRGLKALGFAGCNLTIPHKVNIISYLDELDVSASLTGAVNTVTFGEKCIGYNTDMGGFLRSLGGAAVQGQSAAVLGTGGAARAIVAGLISQGASVTVVGRSPEKTVEFTALGAAGLQWDSHDLPEALSRSQILVNATSLGMQPHEDTEPPVPWEDIHPTLVVDAVYKPRMTRFLLQAQRRGARLVTGDVMLLEQGALAFELFTGQPAPREVMAKAVGLLK